MQWIFVIDFLLKLCKDKESPGMGPVTLCSAPKNRLHPL